MCPRCARVRVLLNSSCFFCCIVCCLCFWFGVFLFAFVLFQRRLEFSRSRCRLSSLFCLTLNEIWMPTVCVLYLKIALPILRHVCFFSGALMASIALGTVWGCGGGYIRKSCLAKCYTMEHCSSYSNEMQGLGLIWLRT